MATKGGAVGFIYDKYILILNKDNCIRGAKQNIICGCVVDIIDDTNLNNGAMVDCSGVINPEAALCHCWIIGETLTHKYATHTAYITGPCRWSKDVL